MAEEVAESARLLRWSGLALVSGGVLLAVATLLHPSRETAATIIASEVRLVAAHVLYTVSSLLVLLGLPGFYVAQRGRMGRLGFAGFLVAFFGTYLLAVSGNFGFLAPVLAKEAPALIIATGFYPPVAGLNGLAAVAFMVGYALLGIAMTRAETLPRLSGIFVAVGGPAYLLGAGIALIVSPAVWPVAVLGSACLGAGLAWPGYRLWQPMIAAT
jgi:hypothetical protein